MNWLLSSITKSIFGHVIQCTNSVEVWSTFERIFVSESKARTMQLKYMLQSLKNGFMNINDYILQMKKIAYTLSVSRKCISDDDLILYILGALGVEYKFVVVNITSRSDSISLQEVKFLLQSQEMHLDQLNFSNTLDMVTFANFAAKNQNITTKTEEATRETTPIEEKISRILKVLFQPNLSTKYVAKQDTQP